MYTSSPGHLLVAWGVCNSEWQAPSGEGHMAGISGSGHFRQFSKQDPSQRAREAPKGLVAAFGETSSLGTCLLHHTPSLNPGLAPGACNS